MGSAYLGDSVALSSDGNTAIVGADGAWVFTRSGGVWSQQGGKLAGSGGSPNAEQGWSVALSADGNTAIVGGPHDNYAGAAWVFTRSGGTWSQQGSKLVGNGAVWGEYGDWQGWSVALSSDGNTAMLGGPVDSPLDGGEYAGAAWVFVRSGGVWSQQGSKLVGSGAVQGLYGAEQGSSVALSSDGNTALVGGSGDNNVGAAWVFTRSGGVWNQQGSKLVGSGGPPYAEQGYSVALSGNGNTAIVGAPFGGSEGGAWVFTRLAGVWIQQGSELVGSGALGDAFQGHSVAVSSDGNTALVGGPEDNNVGAAWVFTRACQVSASSISQANSDWAATAYDHLAGTTIAGRGSALTSLNMGLNFLGETWNPATLNSALDSAGGYAPAPAGAVLWPAATAAATANPPPVFDDLGGWINSDLDLNGAFAAVETGICNATPLPVIVAVRSPQTNNFPGHYVLATGEIVNPDGSKALTINDPAYSTSVIGTDVLGGRTGYANATTGMPEFWTRGAVHTPPPGLTGLSVSVDAVVDVMVTDPNGLQSGFSPGNPHPIQSIPNSGAGVDEIDDDETWQAGSAVETVVINAPAAGAFQISLTGVAAGQYSMEIEAEASDGTVQTFSLSGTAALGSATTYDVAYSGGPGGAKITSGCDDTIADLQSEINQALGLVAPTNDFNSDGVVNVVDVEMVIQSALGLRCTGSN